MSGYRDKGRWWLLPPEDGFTFPYVAARLGFGLIAISLGLLVTGSVGWAALAALVGVPLLAYGLRNY
jgi:hypothetical protein